MLAITHVVVSLLIIQILVLDRNEAFVALMFGVFIDVDHLFGLGHYAESRGVASIFDIKSMLHAGGQWKSLMHNPVAVMVVGPASIASRLAIPLLFWAVHIGMDFAEESFLGNFSSVEATICVVAAVGLIVLRYSNHIETAKASFGDYLKAELDGLRRTFSLGHRAKVDSA